MNKKLVAVAVAAGLALPMVSAHAVEVAGKKLEVYGKFHLSVDSSDTDGLVTTDGLSISSNSSRLGFKGELPAGDMKVVYQLESELFMDEAGGKLANRNTYAGLKGNFGKVIVGNYDTPFKTV
ncbi:MAG: porin, partial [Gammaproteobacteria bacterium]|nr:porin [Gammaproteobacteria bacterium]